MSSSQGLRPLTWWKNRQTNLWCVQGLKANISFPAFFLQVYREYSTDDGDPYYPVPNKRNKDLYKKYQVGKKTVTLWSFYNPSCVEVKIISRRVKITVHEQFAISQVDGWERAWGEICGPTSQLQVFQHGPGEFSIPQKVFWYLLLVIKGISFLPGDPQCSRVFRFRHSKLALELTIMW